MKKTILLIILLSNLLISYNLPNNFEYVKKLIPNIEIDIRYYTNNNFIGKPIDGYKSNLAILTLPAIKALINIQNELNTDGLGLKIFDAYRPQQAVNHFVKWSRDINNIKNKKQYYPSINKKNLFKKGYIAKKSSHSRGSTVDLTIIHLQTKKELDMGGVFDLFSKISWLNSKNITKQQRKNRFLLHEIMLKHGFKAYYKEWWHFSLKNEPYPKTYFDFNVF